MVSRRQRQKRRIRKSRRVQKGGSKKTVVFTNTNNAGFGSVFGFLVQSYIYAKKNGHDFRVKDDNWNYSYDKGWHDYFDSLDAYDKNVKYHAEENYKHANTEGVPDYTFKEYSDAIQDIYKPIQRIKDKAKEYSEQIGGPYVSIYIRRGDKVTGAHREMDAIDTPTLIENIGVKSGNIFLMSDDYRVVEEVQKLLPNCKIFTLTQPQKHGYSVFQNQKESAETRKKNADELFTSIELFHNGEKGWVDNRSNLGRFLKLRDPEKIRLYPHDVIIDPDMKVRPPYEGFKGKHVEELKPISVVDEEGDIEAAEVLPWTFQIPGHPEKAGNRPWNRH
jgi:hypothetical protein